MDEEGLQIDDSDLNEKGFPSETIIEIEDNERLKGDNPLADFVPDDALKRPASGKKIYYSGGDVELPMRIADPIDTTKPIIFMPNDVKENAQNEYYLSIYGAEIGGAKICVHVKNIPLSFHVLVDKKLSNFDYVTEYSDDIFNSAKNQIITILLNTVLQKAQYTKLLKELIDREYTEEDRLKQDMIELCKIYKVTPQKLREDVTASRNRAQILNMLDDPDLLITINDSDINPEDCLIEPEFAYLSRGYMPEQVMYLKITLKTAIMRKRAIKYCHGAGIKTFNNDLSSLYRKAAREHNLPLSAWVEISNYSLIDGTFHVDYKNYKPSSIVAEDKCTVLTHDIETATTRFGAPLPEGHFVEDVIFMHCLTYHYVQRKEPIYQICITSIDCDPDERWITYVCDSQENMLKLFAKIFKSLSPDVITGFNDSEYDWRFIVSKAHMLGVLPQMLSIMDPASKTAPNTRLEQIKQILAKYKVSFEDYLAKRLPIMTDEESAVLFDEYYEIKDILCNFDNVADFDKYKRYLYSKTAKSKFTPEIDQRIKQFRKFEFAKLSRINNLKNCFNYQRRTIKISADDNFHTEFLKFDGCLSMDTRVCFKKIWTKEDAGNKSSLNGYLKLEKMDLKADLPIPVMFKYYHEYRRIGNTQKTLYQNRIIANYCVHDALRCHELMIHRNVYNEYREIATMSFTSVNDAYLIANGAKVRNLLVHHGYINKIYINLIPAPRTEEGKYPGAFVLEPKKGRSPEPQLQVLIDAFKLTNPTAESAKQFILDNADLFSQSRPVTGEDFSSLYPSIMMAYNLSPEKIVLTLAELEVIKAKYPGIKYKEYSFMYNNRLVQAWSILHENVEQNIGLYPKILIGLFNQRASMKKVLKLHESTQEILEKIISSSYKAVYDEFKAIVDDTSEIIVPIGKTMEEMVKYRASLVSDAQESLKILNSFTSTDYKDLLKHNEVKFNAINTKQKALKIFMNTFYGEAGNGNSPLFLLEHAGGVTCLGQYNIKLVKGFVESQRYTIKYGDTDSLYVSPPNDVYEMIDIEYLTGKLTLIDYWTGMVNITMRELNSLGDKINKFLTADNGTKYLKMAYEEVLFPVVFTGKKKYFGKAHVKLVNFDIHRDKDIFIRGIDVIKQGISELAKEIGYNIMKKCLAPITDSVMKITLDEIDEALDRTYDYEKFKLSMAWKPTKDNKTAKLFYKRMEARKMKLPDPGERFYYVVIKSDIDDHFKITGCKHDIKKGQVMEYFDYARDNKVEIDKTYYFNNSVVGICARFINHDPQFLPQMPVEDMDSATQEAAKKFLEKRLKEYNLVISKDTGKEYKLIYKEEIKRLDFLNQYFGDKIDYTLFLDPEYYSKLISSYEFVNKMQLIEKQYIAGRLSPMETFSLKSKIGQLLPSIEDICQKVHEILKTNIKNKRHKRREILDYQLTDGEIRQLEEFSAMLNNYQ